MKNDMSSRASSARSSVASVSSFLNAPQNYWVTTKTLRDKVLAARKQGPSYGNSKYAFKCTSAFQKRNPDNFPMPNSREDAQRSAKSHRTARREGASTMTKNTVYSGAMKSYSKQMFDFAVKCANETNTPTRSPSLQQHVNNELEPWSRGTSQTPRRLGSSYSMKSMKSLNSTGSTHSCVSGSTISLAGTARTGPTPDGSVLYNNKQKVLNSIRLRPTGEEITHRRRTQSRPSLRKTSSDINRQFKVLPTNCRSVSSRPSSVAGSDYIFIPVNDELDYHVIPERVRHKSVVDSVFELDESDVFENCLEDGTNGVISNGYTNGDVGEYVEPLPVRRPSMLLPPSATSNIRLVSLDESSSSESEEEPEVPPPETKKPEPSKNALKGRGKAVIPEPEPEEKPAPPKLILKGPKCWVDDATITSEPSDTEDPDVTDDLIQEQAVEPIDKKQKPDQCNNVNKQNAVLTQQQQQPELAPVNAGGNQGMNLAETAQHAQECVIPEVHVTPEPEIELPPFLCPSSEKKSREAALKDWLHSTCFRGGSRHVPLV